MNEVKKKRIEFNTLIDRCTCFQASHKGICYPSKCFPTLYKELYPKGGLNKKSSCIA